MRAIIDADNLAFACAASAEDNELGIACARANDMVSVIMEQSGSEKYELWLTGKGNFRYNIYPEYKANRIQAKRPRWEAAVKQHLVECWEANWSTGCEADDMLGVRLMEDPENIACHLDKDINMIPGWHYNWELKRLGKTVRESKKYFVTPEEGTSFFYLQMLTGDPTDNIKGVVGIGLKKAEKVLAGCNTEVDMFNAVRDLYSCDEEMEMNGGVLWIWRKLNDVWSLKKYE